MIYIRKYVDQDCEVELLPDYTETELFVEMGTPSQERRMVVYKALSEMLNYYQLNSPTAYGNPEYSRLSGYLDGLLYAYQLDLGFVDGVACIQTRKGTVLLKCDVPRKPKTYFEEMKEIDSLF